MPRRNPSRRCKTTSYAGDSASDQERQEEKQKTTPKRIVKSVKRTPKKDIDSDESDFMPTKSSNEIPDPSDELNSEIEVEPEVKKRQRNSKVKPKRAKRSKLSPPKESQKEKKANKVLDTPTASGQLSTQQEATLSRIFETFDKHSNGRFTLSDLLRVAEDHGQIYTDEEAEDMLRFWDKSGTRTISRETFTELAIESKFMVPS